MLDENILLHMGTANAHELHLMSTDGGQTIIHWTIVGQQLAASEFNNICTVVARKQCRIIQRHPDQSSSSEEHREEATRQDDDLRVVPGQPCEVRGARGLGGNFVPMVSSL
jgi:hypothetical protein